VRRMAGGPELHVPLRFRRGARKLEEDESIDSAVWLIGHMCEHVGVDDLRDTEVLDFGCGVKFTQAFLNHSLPVKRYVGVDVYGEMIEFLRANVHDPRFEYHHIDAHNALYNPGGRPLADATMPLAGRTFDLICLFSVFTHLAPDDYQTMLRRLRPHVRANGRLFFTLYINERTDGGHGLIDRWVRGLSPDVKDSLRGPAVAAPAPFCDLDPSKPLLHAVYTAPYARELIEGTGWEVLALSPPDVHIQHHIVCAPV
jgi:SAM-dependent methyltransferase